MPLAHIGFCPVCQRDIKVRQNPSGRWVLVHHGYRRPGIGSIIGDCPGVGRVPHELSPETAEWWAAQVAARIRETGRELQALPTVTTLYVTKWTGREQKLVPLHKNETPDYEWRHEFERVERGLQRELEAHERERARVAELVRTWTRAPLREEESEAVTQEKRVARTTTLRQKRESRLAEAITRYQGRIDTAVRRQTQSTIADIWENAPYKLKELSGYAIRSNEEARALLERDDVWEAFRLTEEDKEATGRILGDMRYGKDFGSTPPWPPSLT